MRQFSDDVIQLDCGRLRPIREADLGDLTAACNDEALREWLPIPIPYTLDDAREFAVDYATRQLASGKGIERAIESGGRLSGVIGLKNTDWAVGSTEAGYWLAPWGRGKGLMTTALMAMTDWSFRQGLQRVEVHVATRNLPSLTVALRSGFQIEGTLRQAARTHGGLVDVLSLSRLASDPPLW